jgi:dephospho-CoA kinase
MLKVGITGNIGSGKTTVCKVFETLGISVYYADKEAKKLYRIPEVIEAIKQAFGNHIFDEDNQLIPSLLAKIVFNDTSSLKTLNSIIHPLVLDDLLAWAEKYENESYILYESALLFESGFVKHFDKHILVTAPLELMQKRVMHRDHISKEEFMSRANNQMPASEKEVLSDYIINNSEEETLIPQVVSIHKTLINIHN